MLKYLLAAVLSLSAILSAAPEEFPLVWGENSSPFVRKVLLALEHKEIAYENRQVLPSKVLAILKQEPSEEFKQVSPLGKIPAYQEGPFAIADSSVILAYLEKAHPQHALYPSSPQEFAQALWLEEYADTALTEVVHKKIYFELVNKPKLNFPTNDDIVKQALKNELPPILDYLEAQLSGPFAGNYLVGDALTVADLAVGTHFISLQIAGQAFDGECYPRLTAYLERLFQEPAFKKVLALYPETAHLAS